MLVDIVNEQAKKHEVYLLILNNSLANSLLEGLSPKVHIVRFNRQEGSRSLLPFVKLNYWLIRNRPDVVHLHSSLFLRVLLPFVAPNLTMTLHTVGLSVSCFSRLDHIIAISESVALDVFKRSGRKSEVVLNGIVIENIKSREEMKKPEAVFRIINVARLMAETKGQDILIEALALLKAKGLESIHLDLIGEGESEVELRNLVAKHHLEDQVCFLGLRDRKYIYSHLQGYDLMCHPARFEGFGLVIAEGLAAKLPVLVASGDGPEEIIEGNRYGYVFANEDVQACADLIEHIYFNYDEALAKLTPAYEHVQKYSVKRMVQQYDEIYQS